MATVLNIAPNQMETYRATARGREKKRQQEMAARRERARKTADQAAALLKEDYGAKRVVLFGSLARDEPFSQQSDIDLAAWGVNEEAYYRIVSQLLDLDAAVKIDLVLSEHASGTFLEVIEKEGISL